MTGIPSTSLQVVREILVRGDAAARQAQLERLAGEHVDLPSVPLDSERMKVLTEETRRCCGSTLARPCGNPGRGGPPRPCRDDRPADAAGCRWPPARRR